MAISEKALERIERRFERQNKIILNLYKQNGDKSVLDLLHVKSNDAEQVSADFGISLEDARHLIKKQQQEAAMEMEMQNEQALYDKAFEFVASTGNENPEALAEKLAIAAETAADLLEKMREKGDIASDDEATPDSDDEDENADDEAGDSEAEADEDSDDDDSDDASANDDDDSDDDGIFSATPEKIIEALCFLGDVVQDTADKICDVLDESAERVMKHDFDE